MKRGSDWWGCWIASAEERLFTPRFFLLCGFSFTVFLSIFQLLPTAPFRILELGGSKFSAGLFLGFLTYASAFSAPLTGALADRLGRRRVLIVSSLALAVFSGLYATIDGHRAYRWMLALAVIHGVFWSGLLSASSAYIVDIIPERRRAEGIGYWGMSTVLAVSVAPSLGFWVYHRGWLWTCASVGVLNLVMALIAYRLPDRHVPAVHPERSWARDLVEWRVLALSVTLFLYSWGYGAMTSFVALYADAHGIRPKGVFFTIFAVVVLVTRPFSGRLADRVGARRVFLPCLLLIVLSFILLATLPSFWGMVTAAAVFGVGFGTAYPAYVAHVTRHVAPARRGAAFGGILAAFDTGVGTGSVVSGYVVERFGFSAAYGVAAVLSSLALPYFLLVEKRLLASSAAAAAASPRSSDAAR